MFHIFLRFTSRNHLFYKDAHLVITILHVTCWVLLGALLWIKIYLYHKPNPINKQKMDYRQNRDVLNNMMFIKTKLWHKSVANSRILLKFLNYKIQFKIMRDKKIHSMATVQITRSVFIQALVFLWSCGVPL